MAKCPGKSWRGIVFVLFLFPVAAVLFFQARRAGVGPFRGTTLPSDGRRNSVTGLREETPSRSLLFRGEKNAPVVPAAATRMTVTVTRSGDRPERPLRAGAGTGTGTGTGTRGFLSSALETIATAPEVLLRGTKATDCWAGDGMGSDWWVVLTCVLPPREVRARLRAGRRWKFPRGTCCTLSAERPDLRGPGRTPTDMPGHQGTLGRCSCPFLEFPSLLTSSPCPARPAPSLSCLEHTAIAPPGSPQCGPPQPSSPSARPPWTILPRVIINSPASASLCSLAASRAPFPILSCCAPGRATSRPVSANLTLNVDGETGNLIQWCILNPSPGEHAFRLSLSSYGRTDGRTDGPR